MGELADIYPLTPANSNLLPITPDKNFCPLTPVNSLFTPDNSRQKITSAE